MEVQNETQNQRPAGRSNLPAITLVVLIGLIAALLYIGYEYVSDDTRGSDELTNVALDTASQQPLAQEDPEMLMAPEETDSASSPTPVDLSQATPPADAPEANAPAEDVAADNRETTDGKPNVDEKSAAGKKPEKAVAEKSTEKPKAEKPTEKPKIEKPAEKKPEVVLAKPDAVRPKIKPGGVSTAHTVGAGETFYGVANRYNLKLSTLKAMNPGVTEENVKAGVTKLNVKAMAVHTVGPGDVLRVVAQKYGVSKEALMRANHKTKDIAIRGEKLIIPFPEKK